MAKVKRNKRSRIRGTRSGGHGAKKKHRGKGSRGGVGMAGTGKKSGHKVSLMNMKFPGYLGKKGFIRHVHGEKLKSINLGDINLRLLKFEKDGVAKKTSGGIEIKLPKYKVLSKGELNQKIIISAGGFSAKAKEKISAQGSKIVK